MSAPIVRYTTTGLYIADADGRGSVDLDILDLLEKWAEHACSGSIERAIERLGNAGAHVAEREIRQDGVNASLSAVRLSYCRSLATITG